MNMLQLSMSQQVAMSQFETQPRQLLFLPFSEEDTYMQPQLLKRDPSWVM